MSGSCHDEKKKPLVQIDQPLELPAVRARLANLKGRQYWRSLEELADTAGFREMLHREFPRQAAVWNDGVSRRNFMQLMGASLALAGLAGCTKQPPELIVPYVRQPEEIVPGQPLYFATAMPMADDAIPLLVRSEMGRPIKAEGNPEHPAGAVGTDLFAQASLLGMYDPDRSQSIMQTGEVRSWGMFLAALKGPLDAQRAVKGAGLRFLTGATSSPTFASQMQAILKAFPEARWHQYEAVNRDNARAGAQMAFGQMVEPHYRLETADVIVALDADFLNSIYNPNFLRDARAFAARRKAEQGRNMSRFYAVESVLTTTGAKADHRLPVRSADVEGVARSIAAGCGVSVTGGSGHAEFVNAVVKELQQHRGSSVVIAGENQPPVVHALAYAMNQALGNAGKTVVYMEPVAATPQGFQSNVQSLEELAHDVEAGKVDLLVIAGCNPCYTAPDDLNFRHSDDTQHQGQYTRYSILDKVPLRIHFGLYQDETAQICHWHINEAHFLEGWSDVRTADGTTSIIQPLIAPLYNGKSIHELLGAFTDQPGLSGYEWVRNYWHGVHSTVDFEPYWRKSVHDGFVAGTNSDPKSVTAKTGGFPPAVPAAAGMEIVFRPDNKLHDGRFANNGWLQELPSPITMITWDNAVLISLNAAEKLGLTIGGEEQDVVEVDLNGRKLEAVAWITPGQPDDSITLHLGYGRNQAGRTGDGHGYNAYLLRTTGALHSGAGVKIGRTGKTHPVAAVHLHHNITWEKGGDQEEKKRGVLRTATLSEYLEPGFAEEFADEFEKPASDTTLYKPQQHPYDAKMTPHAWGMAIDLNACIGCNTCVVACQSENNIPVVGDWEVRRGREMHWIRIDTSYLGDYGNPETHFQPVPCMQCENAPCEVVCPVGATTHSTEGLNDMVYNRCVGTRYCSNNCPYKVRRFNFTLFSDFTTEQGKLMHNPDVSVRSRGVMEKCTYCVQRITRARIDAEKKQVNGEGDGLIADGTLLTACQQACPADAIVFGNINDPNSRVSKIKAQSNNYSMLAELNTRPRTTYLAAISNPNPELAGGGGGKSE